MTTVLCYGDSNTYGHIPETGLRYPKAVRYPGRLQILLGEEYDVMLYPLMEAVRSGGDLTKVGGDEKYSKTVVCPDGCVIFRLTAVPLGNENFHTGGFWDYPDETTK